MQDLEMYFQWGTVEVYVSSFRTGAFGRYIEGGCCRGVTVMRGSTVHVHTCVAMK